jgi:hypothetical protein
MFGGSGSGSYSSSKTSMNSESDFWTKRQHKIAEQLGGWMSGHDLTKGMPKYQGQLAGSYTPQSMQTMFGAANRYAAGGQKPANAWETREPGSQLFAHYDQYSDPAKREAAIGERLEARRQMLAPQREKQDSAMKAQMASMGLSSSSDVLKHQSDIESVRQGEEAMMASQMRDRYEELGFQASEAGLNRLTEISNMDYQVKNAGLAAEFEEFMRTQPEYSPMIEMMMGYLGLQGVSSTKGDSSTKAWSVSGSAGGMSDIAAKMNVYQFEYKPEFNQPEGVHLGLMAQEVERQFPHLVKEIDGVKHINYATLSAILLAELKRRS